MVVTDLEARVVGVRALPLPYYTLTLDLPVAGADLPRAGQFVMVRAPETLEPYLRRAFSIHDASRRSSGLRIELLAKIVGPGTRSLAGLLPDTRIAVLGPLGRPFELPPTGAHVALVAGGVGSAPLLLLARELLAAGVAFDFYYGGRGEIDLARGADFARLAEASGGHYFATTEDGSAGRKGLVTEPLAEALARGELAGLFACGPMGLLARLAALGAEYQVAAQGALETAMGCGYGACLGCAVPLVEDRFALCCKDGPVFGLERVRW